MPKTIKAVYKVELEIALETEFDLRENYPVLHNGYKKCLADPDMTLILPDGWGYLNPKITIKNVEYI